jgi:hypothetical protein
MAREARGPAWFSCLFCLFGCTRPTR